MADTDLTTYGSSVGRIVAIDNACGCTLSRWSVTGLTGADIVALADKEINLTRVILEAKEAKMIGVKERGLSALLKGKIKDIKGALQESKVDEQSIIMPFIQRTQRSVVNDRYFTLESGVANPNAGVGNMPASAFDITLDLGSSWLATPVEELQRYFLPGNTLLVMTWDNFTDQNALNLQFEIISAVNADAGGTYKATVTVKPNLTDTEWGTMNAGAKLAYQPTYGVAQTGANNVDDRESWCYTLPSNLSKKIKLDWLQTTRGSSCSEQSYEEVLDAILNGKVNDYLKGFRALSLQDQQKQQMSRWEDDFLNSVMFGQREDENQTEALWRSLPPVYDILDPDCQLGVKARAIGFFTQLNDANRVIDLKGKPIDLNYLFENMRRLKKYREADGDSIQVIDCMTDHWTSGLILDTMSKYYTARYGWRVELHVKMGEKVMHDGMIFWTYNVYDCPDAGCLWAVYVDDYFTDLIDQAPAFIVGHDFKARFRNLVFIDWSDISLGIARTGAADRVWGDPKLMAEYKCVITPNPRKYRLWSKTFVPLLDRPQRHLWIINFAGTCPLVTVSGCTVPQS